MPKPPFNNMVMNQESDDVTPSSLLADLSLADRSPIKHPSGLSIRVYEVDTQSVASSTSATSEADEALDEEDSDLDAESSSDLMEQHIERHKEAFTRFLNADSTVHQPRNPSPSTITNAIPIPSVAADPTLHTILKPSASSINYPVMHPFACRHMKRISDLDHFARLVGAPTNWKALFDEAWDNRCITTYQQFVGLPRDTLEANVHNAFLLIVFLLSVNLSIESKPLDQTKVRLGGVTALPEYDYISVSDVKFVGTKTNQTLFCTEINTAASWPLGASWYRDSRLAQLLAALYGHHAPALLFTQQQFKLFVENSERNTIYTFPFGEEATESTHTNASNSGEMSELFFQAIAICLLCEPTTVIATAKKPLTSITVVPVKPAYRNSPEKKAVLPKRKSRAEKQSAKAPSFISGYAPSGGYVYQTVTVYNCDEDEEAERMESSVKLFVDDFLSSTG
ncbi:hypothetical protein HDV05_008771 [Chytridiales sp. JEL 0842]|nr:hypothetical protein HDV05_008771 [Chytridiales sp. JEL 0842]